MNFHELTSYFDSNFTEVCSLDPVDNKSELVQAMVRAVKQQTITRTNVDPDLRHPMASLGHIALTHFRQHLICGCFDFYICDCFYHALLTRSWPCLCPVTTFDPVSVPLPQSSGRPRFPPFPDQASVKVRQVRNGTANWSDSPVMDEKWNWFELWSNCTFFYFLAWETWNYFISLILWKKVILEVLL